MASSAMLRGPIPTGLQDLRYHSQRLHAPPAAVVGCLTKSCLPAVSDASRRLLPRITTAHAASRKAFRAPFPVSSGKEDTQRTSVRLNAAAVATAGPGGDSPEGTGGGNGLFGEIQRLAGALSHQTSRFWSLSGKFMPMVGLFFMLAFVNTILDSLKDTLVITAAGGGAQVIPYLTVYAVLPSSLVFLLLYSYASQRFRRQALFNGIVGVFMAFFVAFAAVLYPNHHLLHPAGWAQSITASLPPGLDGMVGMVRNWTFTLFFCMSELWGDVCLGLLFWGLANDTTSLADAPTLYPLFGLGANVAQALAGFVLKFFSGGPAASHSAEAASFTSEVQSLMAVVLVFSVLALAVHHGISLQDNRQRTARLARERARRAELHAATAAAKAKAAAARAAEAVSAAEGAEASSSVTAVGNGAAAAVPAVAVAAVQGPASSSSSSGSSDGAGGGMGSSSGRRKGKQNMKEIYKTLASSVPIRCLVVMSMAQGLCTNLMEFAWKSHIRLLYPTPAGFTGFLGDVSTWQGIVTGLLMVLSPTMFERMGWAGVAAATPRILLYGGGLFFAAAMAYQFVLAPNPATAASAAGLGVLQLLVYGGALLYVFSKSAKFSLFKPAEEMVYISLDEEGRTKGKAAIDVVGSQAGKSGGSVLQQVLLLLCGGAIAGQLPAMVAVYLAMSQGWLRAVATLNTVNRYGHASSVHESMMSAGEGSLDHHDGDDHTMALQDHSHGGEHPGAGHDGQGRPCVSGQQVSHLQPQPLQQQAIVAGAVGNTITSSSSSAAGSSNGVNGHPYGGHVLSLSSSSSGAGHVLGLGNGKALDGNGSGNGASFNIQHAAANGNGNGYVLSGNGNGLNCHGGATAAGNDGGRQSGASRDSAMPAAA